MRVNIYEIEEIELNKENKDGNAVELQHTIAACDCTWAYYRLCFLANYLIWINKSTRVSLVRWVNFLIAKSLTLLIAGILGKTFGTGNFDGCCDSDEPKDVII